jgi:hypothetical protein
VLGALPELLALAPEMLQLPDFDVRLVKSLEAYALALMHAHEVHEALLEAMPELQVPLEEAGNLRARLLADAKALVQLGLLDERAVLRLSGSVGFKNLASDLQALVETLRGSVARLGARYPTAPDELAAAERVAAELLHALTLREEHARQVASASDLRVRAWTLLKRAYGQACRAVAYLRWQQGDADRIAPSLYATRGRTRPSRKAAAAKAADSTQPERRADRPPHQAANDGTEEECGHEIQSRIVERREPFSPEPKRPCQ